MEECQMNRMIETALAHQHRSEIAPPNFKEQLKNNRKERNVIFIHIITRTRHSPISIRNATRAVHEKHGTSIILLAAQRSIRTQQHGLDDMHQNKCLTYKSESLKIHDEFWSMKQRRQSAMV